MKSIDQKIAVLANHNSEATASKKLGEEVIELVIADAGGDKEEFTMEAADVIIMIMEKAHQKGITEDDLERAMNFKLDRSIQRKEAGTL